MRPLFAVMAAGMCMACMPIPSGAQSRPLTPYCSDRYVVTGTVIGRVQLQRMAGNQITPEMAQTAALWALTVPEKRNQVRLQIRERMRAQGRWGEVEEVLWPMVANDAATAADRAEAGRQMAKPVTGGVLGGVLGGTAGAVFGMATGQNAARTGTIGAGIGAGVGANLPVPTRSPTKVLWDVVLGPRLDAALDRLVRNPCEITAEDALNMVGTTR